MDRLAIQQTFAVAVEELVEQLKHDRAVLAAILCGSLSHDTVWKKSDIDLVVITIDDKKVERNFLALYSNGVNVHALLMSRMDFRKAVEGSVRNSFTHTFLAKGRLLYTHDPTIADLCRSLEGLGDRDTHVQLLRAAINALPPIDKAHKWLATRGDLDYTALWILYAATPLAQMEVISARRLVDREVIPLALTLNPAFFTTVYTDLLNGKKTRETVAAALDAIDAYMAARAPAVFAPVIDYLREAGEVRSCTEIETYFSRQLGVEGVTTACEYLADRRLIGTASTPARLTKKSTVDVQELAFFHVDTLGL
jgi:hypothetical protein